MSVEEPHSEHNPEFGLPRSRVSQIVRQESVSLDCKFRLVVRLQRVAGLDWTTGT